MMLLFITDQTQIAYTCIVFNEIKNKKTLWFGDAQKQLAFRDLHMNIYELKMLISSRCVLTIENLN